MGKRASSIELSNEEREYLKLQTRARTIQAQTVTRARILLLRADSVSIDEIADKVGLNRCSVMLCLKKFKEGGIENALFDAPGRGRNAEITDEEKASILSRFEILDFKDRHPMTLSRGQKQRLTIATAVSSESTVIFFDEPTSGLDKNSMDLVSNSILEISDTDKTLFIISHDYEFLLSVCNRIVYFQDGSIQADFKLNNDTKKRLWELLSKGR